MNILSKRILTSIALIFVMFLGLKYPFVLLITLVIINFLAIKEFSNIFKKIFNRKPYFTFLSIMFSIIYLTFFSLIVWFYLNSNWNINIISFILIIIICALTDTGGFIFGKLIGGKKLTRISPNKTYSGVFGSFIFSLVFGYLFYFYQKEILNFDINIFVLILLVSLISQLGDISISFFKRKAQIKDTGSILPGHGGLLDRIDGILMALPLGIILVSI